MQITNLKNYKINLILFKRQSKNNIVIFIDFILICLFLKTKQNGKT